MGSFFLFLFGFHFRASGDFAILLRPARCTPFRLSSWFRKRPAFTSRAGAVKGGDPSIETPRLTASGY